MNRPIAILAIFTLVASPLHAAQQDAAAEPTLEEGSRIRITRRKSEGDVVSIKEGEDYKRLPGTLVGTLVQLDESELVINLKDGPVYLPLDAVEQLELHTGRTSRALGGAGIGAGVGLALGGVAAASVCEGDCSNLVGGLLVFTGIGALLGAGIGAGLHTDQWRAVPLNQPAVTLDLRPLQLRMRAGGSRVAAQVTLSF